MPLGDLIELKRGYDLPTRLRKEGSIPIVSSSGISGQHSEAKCAGPGVITGRYGTLGKVFFNASDYWPLNTTLYVRDFKGNDPRFVYYLLSSLDFNAYSDKAAVPGLNRNDLHIIEVVRPPLAEQKRIAHILGSLDDKIELNRQMNETLEAMAQALFKDWFVDFGPTRAKMEGREAYLAPEIWELFPDKLGEDGVPVGWRRSTIGEEVTIAGGGTPSTKVPEFWEGGEHYWATPKDMSGLTSPTLLGTQRQITDAGLAKLSSGLLPKGALLLSSRAPIGYLAITEIPTAINQGIIGLVCDGVLSNEFMLQWCKAHMNIIVSKANGSTFLEISRSNFRPICIQVPPSTILEHYDAVVSRNRERVTANQRESAELERIRDGLLNEFFK